MINSLTFWTLLVGVAVFVAKFFYPNLPFDNAQILAAVLFILGLFGITPQFRLRKELGLTFGDLLHSLAFWTLLAGLASFVVHFYAPNFPLDQAAFLAVFIFVLAQFGIVPELRAKGIL